MCQLIAMLIIIGKSGVIYPSFKAPSTSIKFYYCCVKCILIVQVCKCTPCNVDTILLCNVQIPPSWKENSFYPWIHHGLEAWTVCIWCISVFFFNSSLWGRHQANITRLLFPRTVKWLRRKNCMNWKISDEAFIGWLIDHQVIREEEFAPVKNANGSSYDTPDSARLMVLRLHSRWVVAAGGFLTHSVPLYLTGNVSLFACAENINQFPVH